MKNLLTKLPAGATKFAGRAGLVLSKHSPEILLVTGVVGVVGAGVLACKASMKVKDVLEKHDEASDAINSHKGTTGTVKLGGKVVATIDTNKKELNALKRETTFELVKLYAPAVTLGAASIICIVASYGIIRRRNVALVAAYKALDEGYKAYRSRVSDEFGEETEHRIRHGLTAEQVPAVEVSEDGKLKKVKTTEFSKTGVDGNPYARLFSANTSKAWHMDMDYNLMHIRATQHLANDLLKAKGHIFLNEVYDMLEMERSPEGQIVGWYFGGDGDDYIDFEVFGMDSKFMARSLVKDEDGSRAILINFNVDGPIYDKL